MQDLSSPTPDPFLLDSEGLRALASDPVVRRGLAYFAEHRVIELGWDDDRVWAEVVGSQPRQPYQVEIRRDEGDELFVSCDCPFELEPACKHAVAALTAYAARQEIGDEEVESAADEAVADRVRRGRAEVVVEHVAGEPGFGTWSARSLTPSGASLRPYRVLIRSTTERLNTCTCPDFAVNLLGTCKHIEAVLHRLGKSKRGSSGDGARRAVVYTAWDPTSGGEVRLSWPSASPEGVTAALERHFDARGRLRGAPPEAFFAMERELSALPDVHIGEDARSHAERLLADAAHEARGRRIREEILRSGGRIPGVKATLYPYQIEGVAFLAATGRALLADDMGLGKTLQAIAAARYLMESDGVARILVVCPASLKHQWAREIERFTGMASALVQGPVSSRKAQYQRRAPFTIVNYELVLRDRETIQRELAPDLLVLDEAQRIKNWRGRTATAVKSIVSRFAFVLTGTPLENRLEDLYSVMQVVDPRVLGPLWQFLVHFHVSDHRGKVLGYRNLSELRRRLGAVMLRRDKREVRGQLPERVDQRIDVELTAKQRELHDAAMSAASQLGLIARRRPLTPVEENQLMAALQSARMACDAAGLVDKESVGSPKLDELGRLLDELCREGGEKAVVFSQWERMTQMAEDVVRGLGLGYVRLHGQVPTAKRGGLIDRFHQDPECRVFLSTDAGATGLNLQCASVLINLELPFNPAVLNQRIGRVHRLGQRRSVQVIQLLASESYEERVAGLLESKLDLFVSAIEPDSREDVVGVSKRALDLALEALPKGPSAEPVEEQPEPPADGPPPVSPKPEVDEDRVTPVRPEAEVEPDMLGWLLEVVQAVLGDHLERVIATTDGLVCVVGGASEALIREAEGHVMNAPVAIVDRRTWAALSRVGSLVDGARDAWVRADPGPTRESPLRALSRRKLAAAEALAETLPAEALEAVTTAMVAALGVRVGAVALPETTALAVWLYGELVPSGVASAEEAGAVLRAQGLSSAPEVPPGLVKQVLDDARELVNGA